MFLTKRQYELNNKYNFNIACLDYLFIQRYAHMNLKVIMPRSR